LDEPDKRAFQSNYDANTDTYSPINVEGGDPVFSGGEFGDIEEFFSPLLRYQRDLTEKSYYTIVDFIVPMDLKDQEENYFKTGFYMDTAQRQYNQASSRSIIVWCVAHHDRISAHAEKIRYLYR
jgi:hypothetical protein